MGLTPKQQKVLNFIQAYHREHGYAPSQKEIASEFGFQSLGTVQNYLVRLERQGWLQKEWNERRSLKVVRSAATPSSSPPSDLEVRSEAIPLPLSGRVAAGYPIEAIEGMERVDVPTSLVGSGEHFVLEVVGQSMIEDGILEGDYVIIRKQNSAQNGQTVVAVVNNEATIKKFYRKSGSVELHPANAAFKPIIVKDAHDFEIKGIMVGLMRKM